MSLLQIIQDATDELGLPRPAAVVSNTDNTVRALLRYANAEGKALARHKSSWAELQREHTFSTADGTAEYSLPDDFDRFIDDTAWDRANYWEMRGPLSPQDWQEVKSGLTQTAALRRRWRVKRAASGSAKVFFVDPTPSSVDTLVFEYISSGWCRNAADDTYYSRWNADTDEPLLDAEVMTKGVVWRWKAGRGLEYAIDLAEYEGMRDERAASSSGSKILPIGTTRLVLPDGIVPETGFGA